MKDISEVNRLNSIKGLNDHEVVQQRELNGSNKVIHEKNLLLANLMSVAKEPMFILLLIACGVYFTIQEFPEAFTMLAALFFVAGIDVFQNFRSQKAIKALSRITEKKTRVIRNSLSLEIDIESLVTKDIIICEEGTIVPADATILSSNDFSVNEAILTGESASVEKLQGEDILQGTLVNRGYCYAEIKAVGKQTVLSGIGDLVAITREEKTPLQLKVSKFVKIMVFAGSIAFALVWGYHWWESGDMMHGLLHGLTMAMSVLPEEIPVALSTFMALGAYRLLKHGIIARSPKTVETLSSATVICVDKTGTLTQNLMIVANTFSAKDNEEVNFAHSPKVSKVLEYAMWASEENPFDPMEKSIHEQYARLSKNDQRNEFKMVMEFPLSTSLPVMTHVYQNNKKEYIISCKGALEGILKLCDLSEGEVSASLEKGKTYAQNGLRILGVAKGYWNQENYPQKHEDIPFEFLGIITFLDPIDDHIPDVIENFGKVGIEVKMITGDYMETAIAIAKQTHIKTMNVITGSEMAKMKDEDLVKEVGDISIFARIKPKAKMRIINALKKAGEIVAMTGDGVNDAPALKSAHIGISMGKRGTDVAKGAAGLVLSGDDLGKMIDAIFLGRRINQNLIKAIRYIISIHIPIILLVTLPIFIDWLPVMLFAPVHVIFLELIMGPTCSIIYENEPTIEQDLKQPIELGNKNLLKSTQLWVTILQGIVITLGCLIAGYYADSKGFDEFTIRTYIFTTLVFSNIFLTLVNRSFSHTIIQTIQRKNKLIPLIISISVVLLLLILYTPTLNQLFNVSSLTLNEFYPLLVIAFISTIWIEPFKYFKSVLSDRT